MKTRGSYLGFSEKYFRKGTKVLVVGRIQTGSYVNKDGQKVYTTDIIVEEQEFAESKAAGSGTAENNSFVNVPDGVETELPFN